MQTLKHTYHAHIAKVLYNIYVILERGYYLILHILSSLHSQLCFCVSSHSIFASTNATTKCLPGGCFVIFCLVHHVPKWGLWDFWIFLLNGFVRLGFVCGLLHSLTRYSEEKMPAFESRIIFNCSHVPSCLSPFLSLPAPTKFRFATTLDLRNGTLIGEAQEENNTATRDTNFLSLSLSRLFLSSFLSFCLILHLRRSRYFHCYRSVRRASSVGQFGWLHRMNAVLQTSWRG